MYSLWVGGTWLERFRLLSINRLSCLNRRYRADKNICLHCPSHTHTLAYTHTHTKQLRTTYCSTERAIAHIGIVTDAANTHAHTHTHTHTNAHTDSHGRVTQALLCYRQTYCEHQNAHTYKHKRVIDHSGD